MTSKEKVWVHTHMLCVLFSHVSDGTSVSSQLQMTISEFNEFNNNNKNLIILMANYFFS